MPPSATAWGASWSTASRRSFGWPPSRWRRSGCSSASRPAWTRTRTRRWRLGIEDQKFGFSLSSGAAADAVHRVLDHPELKLAGLHCHLGSQLTDLAAYEAAARKLIGLMAAVRDSTGVAMAELNLGGGHAVPYVAGEADFDLAGLADRTGRVVTAECARHRLPVPRPTLEPGRANKRHQTDRSF